MEILMCVVAGLLFAASVYMMLSKSLLRIIIGTGLLSHGTHLMLLSMGGLKKGAAPVLGEHAASYVDPVPQALILTAIVISFGVTAVILVIAYRAYQELGTDNMDQLRGIDTDD